MPRRAARIASAIFVNILAGVPLVVMARGETATAENCLSSPKSETPAGSHWYYRIDHVNKRNCWYLRREGGAVVQATPQTSPPAPQPAAKPSLVDAHAELRPQAVVREDNPVPPASATANPAGADTYSANTTVWNATAAVATRWPELPPASSVPKPAPVAPDPATNVTQAEPAAPAASVVDLPIRPEMLPMLAAATIGVLALAGLVPLLSRRFRSRVRRRKATSAQGLIWETTDDDRIVLSDYPVMEDRDYRPRFARGVASAASRYRAPEVVERAPRRARR